VAGSKTVVKSLLFTSVASLSLLRVARFLQFKFHSKSKKHISFKMERRPVCQIVSSFPTLDSLLDQSSILNHPPAVNIQALPGMEPSGGQENIAPLLHYLETVNLPEYEEQPEVVQLGEELIMTVDDPDLIRLAEESNDRSASSSSDLELQTFLEDWVPPVDESGPESLSGRKKGANKHRKGRTQRPLDEIRKENQPNVLRCRVYRSQKKQKEEKKLTVLQQLELENKELRRKEEEVKEKRDRVQNAYLALINLGRIKFPVGF